MDTPELNFPDQMWAVFNNHVADAGKRAFELCRERKTHGLADLEKYIKSGVMEIFHHSPTSASKLYANLCFAFANGMTEKEGNALLAQRDREHEQREEEARQDSASR